jgi:photosystem II stability/assembly factor-like uncharacterized protein
MAALNGGANPRTGSASMVPMSRFHMLFLALVAGLSFFLGCGGDGNPISPGQPGEYQTIAISNGGDTLRIGDTQQFSAVVVDTAGNTVASPQLAWGSTNTAVATVDNTGRVTGRGEGLAIITATGGGVSSNGVAQIVVQGFGWVDQSDANLNLQNLNGVYFADARRGWAVGDLGTLLATTDAGVTWRRQTSNSTSYRLNAVYFPTSTHGFVVGSAGRVLETTNSGTSWRIRTDIPTAAGVSLNDVFFVDQSLGFIVGNLGLILRTKDGGDEWEQYLPAVTGEDLYSVWATDEPGPNVAAWAVGESGEIAGTLNGGDAWSLVEPDISALHWRGVAMRSRAEAIAVGDQNTVGFTAEPGGFVTWFLLGAPPADFTNFRDIAWPTGGDAFAVGANSGVRANILRSRDGGLSWTMEFLPGDAPIGGRILNGVWFVDPYRGWAVGQQGLILHTATGGTP